MARGWRWVLGLAAAVAGPATAAPSPPGAQLFGAREDVRSVTLSPDGKRLALIRSAAGAQSAVYILEVDGDGVPRPVLKSSGRPDQLRWCSWTAATRLVCGSRTLVKADRTVLAFSRLYVLNADGSGVETLSYRPGFRGRPHYDGGIIDMLADDGRTGSVLMTQESGGALAVDTVDTVTLKRQQVEQPSNVASNFITDGHGTVRVMVAVRARYSGMLTGRTDYFYRKRGSSGWSMLSSVSDDKRGDAFIPVAVDRDLDAAYGFAVKDGRQALYRVALDGSLKRELVLADPHVDVDEVIQLGRAQRVVGAAFTTDRRQVLYFDPKLKAIAAALARAVPHGSSVDVVDASGDEQRLVIATQGDTDAGHFYLYDRPTRQLREIMTARPQLDGVTLATVRPVTFKAADGTDIPAYLTLPPGSKGRGLPAIVMPHGGPEARDSWGFDWLSQFFAHQGYAVLQPNFRGSTGYGADWFGKNGFQGWRTAVGDVDDAGRYLLAAGIAAPGKLAIVGWSYGGYAALQSAVVDPDLYKAVVAIAPVTDFLTLRGESAGFTNAELEADRLGHGIDFKPGSPAQNAARFKAPVLLFHGDLDQNVGIGESRLMAARLRSAGKQVELVEYKGLAHQLDDSDIRTQMLARTDAFLRQSMAIDGPVAASAPTR